MKAILVIDMPSDCNHCQFADFGNGQWECNQRKGGRIGESMKTFSTPSWCPLKPMPRRMAKDFDKYKMGWNACLDELEEPNGLNSALEEDDD